MTLTDRELEDTQEAEETRDTHQMTTYPLRLDPALYERIKDAAWKKRQSVAEWIRGTIEMAFHLEETAQLHEEKEREEE